MPIPVLETDRLTLRGHRLDDFAACAAMWADPIVTRHIGGTPQTEEESWARLLRYVGHWTLLGFGFWVVEEKTTGKFAGEVGFADFKRGLDEPFKNSPEIGWALASEFHGRGYATEAVRAAIAWGDSNFGRHQTMCIIDAENRASIRVAEKCGYREARTAIYKQQPIIVFAR